MILQLLTVTAVLRAVVAPVVTVPFELVNRHIVIGASVNGSRALSFVLDTGDRVAVIDLGRARELGLQLDREVQVGGVGASQMTGYFLRGATLQVAGVTGAPQPVVVALPLGPLSTRLGHDFDGILGTDFIQQFVVEIDYAARTLRLHDPALFVYDGKGESVPIRLNASGHPQIDATVTPLGGEPIAGTFVIDIGSGGGLSLHSPFAAAHRLPAAGDRTFKAMGVAGAGGEGSGRLGRISSLRIGRVALTRPLVLFSEDASGAFANKTIDGNIGYDILRRFRLFLDYAHQRIVFEPAEGIDAPFDRPQTGLVFETAPGDYHRFTVTGILEDSPAAEAGIKRGDRIVSVDGRAASELTLTSISEIFERAVPHAVALRRGAETVTVSVTPRVIVP